MLSAILGFFAGPAGGFIAALVQKGMSVFEGFLAHKQRMEELEVLSRIDLQKADIVYRGQVVAGQDASFKAAIDAQAAEAGGDKWAVDVMKLWRPFLTLVLMVIATVFAWQAGGSGDSLKEYATRFVILAEIALGYWFGVRTFDKAPSVQPAFPMIAAKK